MKRLSVAALALTLMLTAGACQKAEEAKPEVKSAPKAAEKPKVTEQKGSDLEKDTLEACLKRNPDNGAYCHCYSKELGQRFDEKAKGGEVSVQERGQIAVQSAMACRNLNKPK
jgi:hypothetical protein